MPSLNHKVAAAFAELADLLEVAGGDRFKIVAYRRVAEEVKALGKDVGAMSAQELAALRGVGRATAGKIRELVETGKMRKLEEVRATVPPGVLELTKLPGLGPKTALTLASELGISSLDELQKAIDDGRLRGVKGLGRKTEENLAATLRSFGGGERRVLIDAALEVAESILEDLSRLSAVSAAAYCGSLRRMKETIGDLDLLVASRNPETVMESFVSLPQVDFVGAYGTTRTSVATVSGLQVDLRVVAPEQFGAALQYFTGSKEHNVRVREIAVKKGYKLSEYGLFRVSDNASVAGATEEEIYAALGMQTPPPTLRENRGEVEAALKEQLPSVVQLADLRGDLHSHTTYSDGAGSVRDMALAALGQGREYLAITDHLDAWVKSHTVETIVRQSDEIAAVNRELGGRVTVLQGVEVDIGPDGEMALPAEILDAVDLVIASMHRRFGLGPEETTARLVKALRHPRVDILGHPTGRWLGKRGAAVFDLERVFNVAAEHGVALEVNSNPARLDLKDDHLRLAKECGCRFSIATDSHKPAQLSRIRLGVGMAQRGWVTAGEVINALPLDGLRRTLKRAP